MREVQYRYLLFEITAVFIPFEVEQLEEYPAVSLHYQLCAIDHHDL
jgi:hypothetical protein